MKILEDIYNESSATLKLHKISDKISTQKEVRKSDTNSPRLFTEFLEEGIKNLEWKVRNSDQWKICKQS